MSYKNYLEQIIVHDTQIQNSTLVAVEWVKNILEKFNASVELIYNQDKTRASLVATVGNKSQKGCVFSGHLDTVPADETFYKQTPFKLRLEGDRYYGRGVCDMKGSIACFLGALPDIVQSGKTTHLVLSHDEEGIFSAINQLANTPHLVEMLKNQKACIVMEPTCLKPVIAHKGTRLLKVNVEGKSGHSSNPSICIDAIDAAVNYYNHLIGSFKNLSANFGANNDYIEPFSTITVGKFNGGEAINTVAANASFSILSRENPQNDYNQFFADIIHSFHSQAKITMEEKLYAYAFKSSCSLEFIQSLSPTYEVVSYGTEAGFFEKIGLPTVVCGPGSITQAHTKNEYILCEQLDKWQEMIMNIVNNN